MKLLIKNFNEISNNILEFQFEIDSLDDIRLSKSVNVKGKAINNNGKIEIAGDYTTEVITECVRCLEEVKEKLENSFSAVFLNKNEYNQYLKSLDTEAEINQDEIYDEIINDEIDLKELVREYIILDLSPYPQCYPTCKNTENIDKYSDDGIDSRWQQLLQIKNKI